MGHITGLTDTQITLKYTFFRLIIYNNIVLTIHRLFSTATIQVWKNSGVFPSYRYADPPPSKRADDKTF